MAKMTAEEKKAKLLAKKEAAKAKKEAKKAAILEKKRKQAEVKKARAEAKKAKKLAKLEKEKAKKTALKEKKRLAKQKTTKNASKPVDAIDIKEASKTIKLALAQIASQMAEFSDEKRAKKAKSIRWMGYDVETVDGVVTAKFIAEKTKKAKNAVLDKVEKKTTVQPEVKKVAIEQIESVNADDEEEEEPKNIEVPAGDLYGQNGCPTGEVANLENDDEYNEKIDDDDEDDLDDGTSIDDDDNFSSDFRDEQDEDIVNNRAEFFSQFGEDFEPSDN